MSPFEGKTMEFKVIKLDRKRNNVVLSRRAVVEASMGEERAKLPETLQEGAIVNGVVKNITEYGAFVDLGGIDGLLHITDMAWRRVRHPSEVVTVGQELTAKVLKFDAEKNRVSLGIKQLGDDPGLAWPAATRPAPACSARSPTLLTTAPSSRSSPASKAWCTSPKWTGPTRTSPRQVGVAGRRGRNHGSRDRRRQASHLAGHEAVQGQPWEEFAENVKRGDKVKGPVKSITDFGVFIGLAQGIDGLVHLSDLS